MSIDLNYILKNIDLIDKFKNDFKDHFYYSSPEDWLEIFYVLFTLFFAGVLLNYKITFISFIFLSLLSLFYFIFKGKRLKKLKLTNNLLKAFNRFYNKSEIIYINETFEQYNSKEKEFFEYLINEFTIVSNKNDILYSILNHQIKNCSLKELAKNKNDLFDIIEFEIKCELQQDWLLNELNERLEKEKTMKNKLNKSKNNLEKFSDNEVLDINNSVKVKNI